MRYSTNLQLILYDVGDKWSNLNWNENMELLDDKVQSLITKTSALNTTSAEFLESVTAPKFIGNSSSSTKLETARTITIGNKGLLFDGTSDLVYTLADINASEIGHTHEYLPLAGGTVSGTVRIAASTSDALTISSTIWPTLSLVRTTDSVNGFVSISFTNNEGLLGYLMMDDASCFKRRSPSGTNYRILDLENYTDYALAKSGATMDDNAKLIFNATNTRASGIYFGCAGDDGARIIGCNLGSSEDTGCLCIDTGDNGTEPILVRQMLGSGDTTDIINRTAGEEVRRAYLLNSAGNTEFPGIVYGARFEGPASKIFIPDNRNVVSAPADYAGQTAMIEFRYASATGLSDYASEINGGDHWTTILTTKAWHESSGGSAYQVGFARSYYDNTKPRLFIRTGPCSSTSWGAWRRIMTSDDAYDSYIPRSGGNMNNNTYIHFVADTGYTSGISFNMGGSDFARIMSADSGDNAGALYIDTADDGSEQIICRQFSLVDGNLYGNLIRSATILGSDGNTTFPQCVISQSLYTHDSQIAWRQRCGNYSVLHYQDGMAFYFLVTNSGDQEGTYNSLRPFAFSLIDGNVTMAHNVYGGNIYSAVWNDYAEYYERGSETEPGDIIELDLESDEERYIKASPLSEHVVGVHSDSYGFCVGGDKHPEGDSTPEKEFQEKKYIPVGLNGRVRTKIINPIQKGDFIVVSAISGVGRKYNPHTDPRYCIIGFATETNLDPDIKRVQMQLKTQG